MGSEILPLCGLTAENAKPAEAGAGSGDRPDEIRPSMGLMTGFTSDEIRACWIECWTSGAKD